MRLPVATGVCLAIAAWTGALGAGERDVPTIVAKSVQPESDGLPTLAYGLTREDYRRIVAAVPTLRRAVPVREMTAEARHRDHWAEVQLIGTSEQYAAAQGLEITRGRFLTPKDVKTLDNVAVIDRQTARWFFPHDDPIGQSLPVGRTYFLIVGVVSGGPDDHVYVPLSTMRARVGDRIAQRSPGQLDLVEYELSRIYFTVANPAQIEAAANLIRRIVEASHEEEDYSIEIVR